jgi:hypothetical protein
MSFFVRTISEWNQGQCRIPLGMTLEGRIAKVTRRAPGVKREEISLSFLHIPCSGNERRQLIPILSAIHGSQKELDDSMLDHAALSGLFAAAVGGHPVSGASGPGGTAPPANGYGGVIPQTSRRDVIRAGEVRDYPGVKLALPTYLSDPTIVYASGEIFFDPDARFILVVRLTENAPAVETDTLRRLPATGHNERRQCREPRKKPAGVGPVYRTCARRELCKRRMRDCCRYQPRDRRESADRGSAANSRLSAAHRANRPRWA